LSGYVELKNWKRLSTDDVASDPSATVEDILGDVIAIATLRIRLSNRSVKRLNPASVVTSARTRATSKLLPGDINYLIFEPGVRIRSQVPRQRTASTGAELR